MSSTSNEHLVLVLNCGSSSIKFAVFNIYANDFSHKSIFDGKVQGICGPKPSFETSDIDEYAVDLDIDRPYRSGLGLIYKSIIAKFGMGRIKAIGHRVVHGGSKYFAPVQVDATVLEDLKSYIPLAPLHQPFALEAIEILLEQHPNMPQIVCFDTCFHSTMPQVEKLLPLPLKAWDRGIRRYGFHGLSYDYIASVLPQRYGDLANKRLIVAHLGSGASLCAMRNLKSVATSMGFSALGGLMMGTRTGSIDPGAIIYLMEIEKLSLAEVADVLYNKSGLLGVSGISDDPRDIIDCKDRQDETGECARLALDLYVHRVVSEIGSMTAALGGLDLLVFTAGIGEHSVYLRQRICARLEYMGIKIDESANQASAPVISKPDSIIKVGVEPTNEELMVAKYIKKLIGLGQSRAQ